MYGISNSQQQGGGGGSAASYKAIKSTLTPSDWQEVEGATPFFVGENAMEWAVNEEYGGMKIKSSPSALGLQLGVDYTATINVDNVTYTQTAQIYDPSEMGGMKVLVFGFSEDLFMYIYDGVAGIMPGVGDSFCAVPGGLTATSFVVTNFEGEGFGTSIQATISDSAIKVNSAVTLYTNTDCKLTAGEKTNGSITLTANSVPTVAIPYSLEIVGTDTEGLFEIVNGYTPPTIEVPTALPQKTGAVRTGTLLKGEGYIQITNSDITANSDIIVNLSYQKEITGDFVPGMFALSVSDGEAERDIPFTYKVKQTDGKGQFTIVNNYSPSVSDVVLLKTITNTSTNVYIAGDASPYKFSVRDTAVTASKFVRLYPNDADTETWLNTHTVSSIITEENGLFTFNVDTDRLPSAFSIKYMIESLQ